jgi:hypothetical protein
VFSRVKCLERESDHTSPSNAEVKNEWSYTSNFHNVIMVWTGTILLSFYFLRRIIRIRTALNEWTDANASFCYVIRTFVPLLNNGNL